MNQYAHLIQPETGEPAIAIQIVDKAHFEAWLLAQPERVRTQVAAQKFTAKPHEMLVATGDKAGDWSVVLGVANQDALKSWCLAKASEALPAGMYRLADGAAAGDALFGWMLGQYQFTAYKKVDSPVGPRVLLTQDVGRIDALAMQADATALVRDLVNTPAEDMGPDRLEAEANRLARTCKADLTVTAGEALLTGFPMIHAVGRAAKRDHAPRLLEILWGDPAHPRIAIVGKGVCFDSGGLDIKTAAGMLLMKKDMGGAAHAFALAELVMRAKLPVRLHLLVAAVENAIAGNAFRPGDVLKSRAGISVEIGNTDAEGRLVLGDALTRACEDKPELILDFATLTGAARVALGPDLPALFANDDALALALVAAGKAVHDPVWQLPLWDGYVDMLASDIADTNNSGAGGFAGAVTAALFLKKFVTPGTEWAHFDTYSWRPTARPGQSKGGEALGLRASWRYLRDRFA